MSSKTQNKQNLELKQKPQNNRKAGSGAFMLLLAAAIWGFAFVAQSVGMDYIGPFTFSGVRCLLGVAALTPLALLRHRNGTDRGADGKVPVKTLLIGSLVCGIFLCIATNLQQIALIYTTVGKAGFITAMYIVFVPVLRIFLGKKARLNVWAGVLLASAGLYMLCMSGSMTLQSGDLFCFACAIFFAFQILAVDHFAPQVDGVLLSLGEFSVCGVISLIIMAFTERPTWEGLAGAGIALLYTGICSSGIAYTLQILGQQRLEPAKASILMCMESPISVLAGWILLGQALTMRELLGCALMFAAILISQREPDGKKA